ncbi:MULTISPECIES: FAD-binding oxidoreductase [unclassified Mesorhizobium]|uniref:FAD-binding oxidoreductase n=2 Tax=Mesorhizobium TaxID=68287 RepID=UPI000FCABEE7|nr:MULTISPECIES: FAD-binding oxidoreductase [unclassified Mesorhizobium]TGP20103.1 FAD-binding oxidoreductase [Mesorhizobium sp. M1D.F.Ca.ET.231.01.1.1]TGP27475.1 FAD-binding oxidoreductase [Mesorhizobium sp. M1D.F.Ca.ET.234.01.1.1]TGS41510.1 FAD-binding oxidoreductase [Mesorhizobium sp. M1D.F.Ca.ET.184.01.1.1]TGS59271.1 FAD-binding oxidoreductase [Mesorhizobium sp. M1D.F.Ca.ET.183.01.1.1]
MTTPITAEIDRASTKSAAVEIDGFRGRLISAEHADYDLARAVWNGAIDRHPRLVARCTGTADTVAAVRFARDHDLEIAIRGGGHNVAGTAVCDDGIVIDLSAMRGVRVDPTNRRAWVQGGALWGDVDHETQAYGLATTGGIVSHTGVAGLTLGGGVGWLMRKHGLTADNLLAVDIVTADGELLRASEQEHPELIWALRGGGGNFGVVTSFEFRLHPVGPNVLAGPIIWDATDAGEVLRFYRDFVRDAPDELGTVVRFGAAPPLPVIPADLHWRPVMMVGTCYAGPIGDGEQALRPLRTFRTPVVDLVAATPYVGFQSALDSTVPHGWNYYWKSTHLPELRDDLIDVIIEHAFSSSSPRSYAVMFHLKGAVSRVPEGGTAFGNRQASHAITLDAVWRPGEGFGDRDTAWAKGFFGALGRFREGVYVNFLGGDEDPARVREAYGEAVYDRLVEVKTAYDPDNTFHHNQNIRPAGS